ncbi:hypothetical protein LPB140_06250 [Sphingorhabdus lutea]|uniref:TIGR03087 family PEP-CTERM/XrtA system glycosyltransferase n=1 Tax=Sphingorhabdus lutea TaxID=1913578 RepID=A0A1L3JBG3_9SPHN|nr:TIGR03087 family PEP-CTERM/XrtA system glycosyltransferase [Sphingorhabdus lutea]APG62456.1 hypothetical protein LPB140_06250 [Sphingorhabdus lutea]
MTGDILFICHRIPWPPNRGDKIRSYHILHKLRQIGNVHLASFYDDRDDEQYFEEVSSQLSSHYLEFRDKPAWRSAAEAILFNKPISLTSFASNKMQKWINNCMQGNDIKYIFIFSGQMAQFINLSDAHPPIIMDFVDVDSAKFASYAQEGNLVMRHIYSREAKKLGTFEAKIAAQAKVNFLVSEAEAALFRGQLSGKGANVMAMGNGIDHIFFDPESNYPHLDKNESPYMVFTGQMDYRPNVEAVCDFAQNMLPKIREQIPNTQFAIVGRAPTEDVRALSKIDGVEVIGAVDDIRSWLAKADIIVAPLRTARGVQNKVLEAMAMGKAVLCSALAAEGIDAQNGEHFMVAKRREDEADLAIKLLQNAQMREEIGSAARAHVIATYDWSPQLGVLDQFMQPDDME